MYSNVMESGLKRIYDEDYEVQKKYLDFIMEKARGTDSSIFKNVSAFFVPNEDYLADRFGNIAREDSFDLYVNNNYCRFLHKIMIPVYNTEDRVVGMIGYDFEQTELARKIKRLENIENRTEKQEKLLEQLRERKGLKYILPSIKRIKGSNYLYFPKGCYRKALEMKYVVVVDGIFDCIQLNNNGIPAVSLMGSEVTKVKLFLLSLFDTVFVAYDNDASGVKVLKSIQKSLRRVVPIKNRKTGDIDDYIREYGCEEIKYKINESLKLRSIAPITIGNDKRSLL